MNTVNQFLLQQLSSRTVTPRLHSYGFVRRKISNMIVIIAWIGFTKFIYASRMSQMKWVIFSHRFVCAFFAGWCPAYFGPKRWDHIAVQCQKYLLCSGGCILTTSLAYSTNWWEYWFSETHWILEHNPTSCHKNVFKISFHR